MQLSPDFDLTRRNTLGLPSKARFGAVIAKSDQIVDLAAQAKAQNLPLYVIGGGSNLVLRDHIDAVIALMATKGKQVTERRHDHVFVTAQAGEDWSEFVEWTVNQNLGGLENLAGIPGTVGAAPIQNIGAYGLELADRFHSLTAYDTHDGRNVTFMREACAFSYRNSFFKRMGNRYVVLDVTFALPENWQPVLNYAGLDDLPPGSDAKTIMDHVLAIRRSKLPDWRVIGNAGSFFHNPVVTPEKAMTIEGTPRYPQGNGTVKLSAAWLIDACGFKGFRHGNAGIYDKHALIVINHGGATYDDVAALALKITQEVEMRFGITLTQEPLEL